MKRFLTIIVVLTMLISVVSCGKTVVPEEEGAVTTENVTTEPEDESVDTEDKKLDTDRNRENDAVTAAAEIEYRKVESGCHAERYTMDLTLDPDADTLSGMVTVVIINNSGAPLNEICFRYFAPAFEAKSDITRISNSEIEEEYSFTKEVENTFYRAALPEALDPGESISLDVEFTSFVPADTADRFGVFSIVEGEKLYNFTFCFPQVAFLDNGHWFDDEYFESGEALYNEMSDYYVTLTAPEDYTILSSGKSVTEGTKTEITAENVREMAISACNCGEVYTKVSDGITYNVLKLDLEYENKELLSEVYELIMETAIESVEIFSRDVGDYIYDEIDIIPFAYSDGTFGGMEYPGLVQVAIPLTDQGLSSADEEETVFDEEELVWDEEDVTVDEEETEFEEVLQDTTFFYELWGVVITTAHEVGHEWFYCAVGNDEFNETWIDESFTSYLDAHFSAVSERSMKMLEDMCIRYGCDEDEAEYIVSPTDYTGTDELVDIVFINLPADEYSESDYGNTVYGLGAYFLMELEDKMGADKFFEMLSDWYYDNLCGIAEGYAFINHLMEYDSSDEVKELVNTYVHDECLK